MPDDPRGVLYFGSRNFTTNGLQCQYWASQYPHPHAYIHRLEHEGDKCRNRVDGITGRYGPWCYTTDPDVPWQYCEIPKCGEYTTHNVRTCTHNEDAPSEDSDQTARV